MSTENEHGGERDDEDEGETSSDADDETEASEEPEAPSAPAEADDDEEEASSAPEAEPVATATPVTASPRPAAKAASAGARLAAAKAKKAAKKAAKKQAIREEAGLSQQTAFERAKAAAEAPDPEQILTQSPLGRAATRAGEWAEANRQLAIGGAAVAAIALFGWLGWSWWTSSQASAAGQLLADAIEISSAEIVAPDAEDETEPEPTAEAATEEDPAPTFESIEARNEAALAAYERVSAEYPGSAAALWARLGEGRTLVDQGQYDAARTAYEAAFHASGDESVVAWQALEGIGASYEAEENWAEATATYERLSDIAEGAYASAASYHLARMHAASGDEAAAQTAFRELVDSLQEGSEDGEPPFPYVLAQAELRLRELDPSSGGSGPSPLTVPDGEGGGLEGLEGMDPEQLQELIRQLQTKSGGGAP